MVLSALALASAALKIAENYKTVFMLNTFGSPVTTTLIRQRQKQYPSWYTNKRVAGLYSVVGKNYFGFDDTGVVTGILWGWRGDSGHVNGGAVYGAGGIPDMTGAQMAGHCKGLSSVFSTLERGEILLKKGHVGVYVGDGVAVEATTEWTNSVQRTAVSNLKEEPGLHSRKWEKHGKLEYVAY
ncbi:putative mannosyl-glycoprotein endo-beta-N-acetylglucosaminidase [Blattamonas nauphoetae]|nr:putative mannosyl-glycoprotein endo-beta-N-acetylglucosaminidase [Blattamonas nauphoetae]